MRFCERTVLNSMLYLPFPTQLMFPVLFNDFCEKRTAESYRIYSKIFLPRKNINFCFFNVDSWLNYFLLLLSNFSLSWFLRELKTLQIEMSKTVVSKDLPWTFCSFVSWTTGWICFINLCIESFPLEGLFRDILLFGSLQRRLDTPIFSKMPKVMIFLLIKNHFLLVNYRVFFLPHIYQMFS